MPQKMLNPFSVKEQIIYPGVIKRNDKIFIVDVTCYMSFSIIYNYLISRITAKLCTLSFQELRKVKMLCGIGNHVDIDNTASAITKILTNNLMSVVYCLTEKQTTYALSEFIMCDIIELPKLALDLVQFINSHKVADYVVGSGNSIIKWGKCERQFSNTEFEKNKDSLNPVNLLLNSRKITEIFRELNLDEIVKLSSLQDLFAKSKFVLNGSVVTLNESEFVIETGDNFDSDDLLMYMLCAVRYDFQDKSMLQINQFTLDTVQMTQVLRMPIGMLLSGDINFTSNEKLVNQYIESELVNMANRSVEFKGFKSKGRSATTPKSTKSSLRDRKSGAVVDLPKTGGFNKEVAGDDIDSIGDDKVNL